MPKKDELQSLLSSIRDMAPYITATLEPGCTFDSKEHPGWIEVHEGRVGVSIDTIKHWEKLAKELLAKQ